ncbi:hypothetical protein ACF07T_39685 [Streptomyces sp. NPDC015184]|uniref:hypothetical protein n=1 Tax=Streptomyces sp. NPDC015184 TaxID=3364946 RepID=UPI003700E95F
MSDTDLIVPIQLHALVYNRMVHTAGGPFTRWNADYAGMLDDGLSLVPAPGNGQQEERLEDFRGVHLMWQLPEALTGGHYDPDTEETSWPLVPNRWLVVRYFDPPQQPVPDGRQGVQAVGWVVHSDYREADYTAADFDGTLPYGTNRYIPRELPSEEREFLGRHQQLGADEPWREPPRREPFLTAVGPGLPDFAAYHPYNRDVFSFHDTLSDLEAEADLYPPDNRLSYLVVGWYSEGPIDLLQQAISIPGLLPPDDTSPEAILAALGWALPQGVPQDLRRSLYSGTALGITWRHNDFQPPSDKPEVAGITVAVGHSTGDAAAALTANQTPQEETGSLFSALYHGTIDTFDTPDGSDDLAEGLRTTWFGGSTGGYSWRLADRPAQGSGPTKRTTGRVAAPGWLLELNARQAQYDRLVPELEHLQWRTWSLYWLRTRSVVEGQHPPQFDAAADAQLSLIDPNSLASRTKAKHEEVLALLTQLPYGTTPQELEASIAAYVADKPLPEGTHLIRDAAPPFYRPSDPVIVVEGAGTFDDLTRDTPLPCRLASDLLESVKIGTGFVERPADPAKPNLTNLPDACLALLQEFALLDQASWSDATAPGPAALHNAVAHPAQNTTGSLAEHTAPWRQPWLPLYVQWDVRYIPTPYHSDGADNWEFDGTTYQWKGTGSTATDESSARRRFFRGRSFLTPTMRHVVRAQLARYLETYPQASSLGIAALREDLGRLDLLSQTLDGFNDWLLLQGGGPRLLPPGDMADLLGDSGTRPVPGDHNHTDAEVFQPVRAGQFFFHDLRIIDRFGRTVDIVNDRQNHIEQFTPVRAASVTPPDHQQRPLFPDAVGNQRFIQLPPRILQGARVRLEAVNSSTGAAYPSAPTARDSAAPTTPVAGWLLVNHLDQTLMVYGPGGEPLGELRVLNTTQSIAWNPLPHSPHPDPASTEFRAAFPVLAGFLAGLRGQPQAPAAFAALLATIDQALDLIVDPAAQDDDVPAKLIGRPIALLRADLAIDLQGPPLTNPGWATVLDPPAEAYPTHTWPVRLGDAQRLTDGLIGYYATTGDPGDEIDYQRLNATAPAGDHPYLRQITTGQDLALPARQPDDTVTHHLTLLAEPHAPVHAISDILPVSALQLDADLIHQALKNIRASFLLNPLLAPVRPPLDPEETLRSGFLQHDELVMPRPAAWHGTWTWAEPREGAGPAVPDWLEFPIAPADTYAFPGGPAAEARAGYLQLRPTSTD